MINLNELANRFNRDSYLEGEQLFPTNVLSISKDEAVAEFRARYQSYNLLRKLVPDSVPESHRQDAMASFAKNQERGKAFNESFEPSTLHWFEEAKHIVAQLLGPLDSVWSDIWPLCAYGPGTFNGAQAPVSYSLHYKIGGDQTATTEVIGLYLEIVREFFPRIEGLLKDKRLTVLKGNRLSHVAKDAKKCRPISIEPSCNIFLQQGVGRYLMRTFRSRGFLDLYHGQELNRKKASCLSNGTIDLSSASDTIYRALVKALLPADWYYLMDLIRSKTWSFRDQTGVYENFSSQGNGFTFPLESLIFKAICMASTGLTAREVTVYGDDMILPLEHCPNAIKALTACGFIVNDEKSYYGQHDDCRRFFRESCGADYYMGELVTPVYIRKQPRSLSEVCAIFNRMIECWPSSKRALSFIVMSIDPGLRKKMLIGPRCFVTDDPSWVSGEFKTHTIGINSYVSTYSSWFWSEGPLKGLQSSNLSYVDVPRKIPLKLRLGGDVDLAEFLYGGSGHYARLSNPRVKKQVVTPVDWTEKVEQLEWSRKAPWLGREG